MTTATCFSSDCEGGELQLLDPEQVPGIQGCDVIVECHDFLDASITSTLRQRFAATHDVELIRRGRGIQPFPVAALAIDRSLARRQRKSSHDDELAGLLGPLRGRSAGPRRGVAASIPSRGAAQRRRSRAARALVAGAATAGIPAKLSKANTLVPARRAEFATTAMKMAEPRRLRAELGDVTGRQPVEAELHHDEQVLSDLLSSTKVRCFASL